MTVKLDTRDMTLPEAIQTTKDYCRGLLEQWEQYETDKSLLELISALRWYLSHNRWPRKKEPSTKVVYTAYEYDTIQNWPLQQITNMLRKIVSCVFTMNSPEYHQNSLKKRAATDAKAATIGYLLTVQPIAPVHPDYFKKWSDPKKCLPDGTRVWEDSGIPRLNTLMHRPGEFAKKGGGTHDYNGFVKAMKNYDTRAQAELLAKTPPTNKQKTKKEVAEAMALKNRQREEAKIKRAAIDAEGKRRFDEAAKKRKEARKQRR
jgi:hypothetical protein